MHRNNNAPQKLFQLNVQHNGRTRSLLELVKSRLIDQNLTLDHYFSLMIIMGKCLQAWPDVLICHLSRTQCIKNIFKFVFEIICFKDFTTSFHNFQISVHFACFKSNIKIKIMCYFIKSLASLSNFRISSGIPILDLTKPNLTSFENRTCFF